MRGINGIADRCRCVIAVLLVAFVAWGMVSCGSVTFVSGFQPKAVSTVNGFVSVIQFSTIRDGNGTAISVTAVTFEQNTFAFSTVTFCGNLGNQFLLNTFTTVDFNQGSSCATALKITVGG